MAFDKLKKIIGDDVDDNSSNNENETKDGFKDNSGKGSKMVLIEPRAYSEAQAIADCLKQKKAVVVNMKRVTPDQAKRIVDFLSGTLYAINGEMQKLGNGIFLCTPSNIGVEGKMTSLEENKTKGKKESEEDYNW